MRAAQDHEMEESRAVAGAPACWPQRSGCARSALCGSRGCASVTWILVVAPTLTADEMHPGALRRVPDPEFPAAMTVAIPTERRVSIAALTEA